MGTCRYLTVYYAMPRHARFFHNAILTMGVAFSSMDASCELRIIVSMKNIWAQEIRLSVEIQRVRTQPLQNRQGRLSHKQSLAHRIIKVMQGYNSQFQGMLGECLCIYNGMFALRRRAEH
ncbi:hypothetical protein OIU78_004223 [Salix suchowensis]|nr:hypothetical protein OIU78_004223 [Salix suchowensis]